jgi:hypothetical protein
MRITYFGFAIRHLILVMRYKLHPTTIGVILLKNKE